MRFLGRAIMLLSCLSAASFVGVGVLFVRSAWVTDQATHVAVVQQDEPARWRAYKVRSHRGRLFFSVLECADNAGIYDPSYLGWRIRSEREARIGPPKRRNALERLGFIVGRESGPPVNPWWQWLVYVPHWAALLLFGGLSTPLWTKVRRSIRAKRRAAAGLCVACGYDIRATAERCPECGAVSEKLMMTPR
jgi:hypothetical protein